MCKAKKIITQMSVGLVLVVASTAFAQDPDTRKIYFQGEVIELTPRADRLAVRFGENVAAAQKKGILEDKHDITKATLRESFTNPRIDVVTVEAADIAQVLRNAHKMAQDADIEYATPVFRSYGIDLIPTGELFVQLTAQAGDDAIGAIKQQFNLEEVKRTEWRDGNYLLRATAQSRDDVFAICEQILERADVEFSQPNFIRRLKPMDVPNDPLFGSQWGLHNVAQALPNSNEDCDADAPEGWCVEKGCAEVIIAIIDDGCDMTHPDYQAKLVAGFDFTDNNADCTPLPDDSHGTACAGIAAANTNNGLGVAGVNWHARIMPIRIAWVQGGFLVTTDQWLSDGIAWAYQNGADVLSNSWGDGPPSAQIHAAIRDAVIHGRNGKGAVVAFAAGNSDLNPPVYPGRHPESFCVGATSPCDEKTIKDPNGNGSCDGEHWWGSNYGDALDVAAPGVKIPTTDIQGAAGHVDGDYRMDFNGTSAATPHVAGLASLVICKYPDYTGLEVQARIEQTCDKVGGYAYSAATGRSFELGHGRVNIYRAMSGKPQVELGPLPDFPSVYRDVSDQLAPYETTLHESAACEWLGMEYSPEKSINDADDPDGKQNFPNQDAFDDAVHYFPPYRPGELGTIAVTVSVEDSQSNRYDPNNIASAPALLYVNVWFDWEADGDWNNSYDWVVKNEEVSPGTWGGAQSLTFIYDVEVPTTDVGWHLQNGQDGKFMNVRTRLTYNQELADANEDADFGEVEDDHFLNFVEMFDNEFNYYMDIASYACSDWKWIDENVGNTCHPPFRPDEPFENGYMVAESNLTGNPRFNSGLRTPSFDLTELTRASLEFEHSSIEAINGDVRLYKNGVFHELLASYNAVQCSACVGACFMNEVIDLTPWCGDGNDDIVIEFRPTPLTNDCVNGPMQDWKVDNVIVWGDDIIDPATVAVNTAPQTETSNLIDWMTPGDDGDLRQAETYNLRYGPKPIDAGNWRHALWVLKRMVGALPVPQLPGAPVNLMIQGLSPGLHHFSVSTMDEVTNTSGIGAGGANNAPVQIAPAAIGVNVGALVAFNVTAIDADFDPLLMHAVLLPIPACAQPPPCLTYVDNLDNTGTFTWQTEAGDVGPHQVIFQATDPNGLNDVDVTIIIVGVPPPTGACCDGIGGCMEVTQLVCINGNGNYQGDGTTCMPNPCVVPNGACCDPTGGCAIETAADCGAAGGTYQGDNTACLPGMCPATIDFIMPPATYATGVMPVAVAAGDLDADGDEDLVVANRNSGTNSTVTILTNDGTGVFVGSDISIVGSPLEDIVLADLDADGDLDLASASGAAVVNWNDNGSFGVWRMMGVGANPTAIVAADFDGDCTIDLATANSNPPANNVAVVLNVDGLYYSPLTTLYAAGTNPVDLAAGDIDGDGDSDLVVANASSADVSVLFNDGLGNFSAPLSFASGMPNCCLSAVALGDLDGDLDLDVVVTNGSEDQIAVLFNDGIGNLSAPTLITVGNFPADVVAADLDGDGDLDLVLTNANSPYQVQVLTNIGGGNFAPPLNFLLDPGPKRIAVANLDNSDGALDLAVTLTGPDKVAVLINATDQDCNGNGIADQIEPSSSMSFNVTGTSSATFCTWRVHGTGFDLEGEFCVTAGAGGEAFATEIVERINDTGCPGIRAEHVNGLASGFTIIAPGNSLNFCIGTAPGVPGCCFPGAGICSCNPDIEELLLAGDDCNGNGVDDVIDILNGTSQDLDGDGIPDECIPSLPADLDGDGDVDAADLAMLLASWGPYAPCPPYIAADLNQDCSVDAADLAGLLASWGP